MLGVSPYAAVSSTRSTRVIGIGDFESSPSLAEEKWSSEDSVVDESAMSWAVFRTAAYRPGRFQCRDVEAADLRT